MLEVGAYNELWKAIHMGPDGAARLLSYGRTGLLMPIHWGLFELAPQAWREPIERITELADGRGWKMWSPEPGMPTEVVAGEPLRSNWWPGYPGSKPSTRQPSTVTPLLRRCHVKLTQAR